MIFTKSLVFVKWITLNYKKLNDKKCFYSFTRFKNDYETKYPLSYTKIYFENDLIRTSKRLPKASIQLSYFRNSITLVTFNNDLHKEISVIAKFNKSKLSLDKNIKLLNITAANKF